MIGLRFCVSLTRALHGPPRWVSPLICRHWAWALELTGKPRASFHTDGMNELENRYALIIDDLVVKYVEVRPMSS